MHLVALSIYNRILQKAADLVGGHRALARYLKVPLLDLYAWMRPGAEPPPDAAFLNAVDLVLNDLDVHDAARAQRIRAATLRADLRREKILRALQALVPVGGDTT
jgi:hypothetical protein